MKQIEMFIVELLKNFKNMQNQQNRIEKNFKNMQTQKNIIEIEGANLMAVDVSDPGIDMF